MLTWRNLHRQVFYCLYLPRFTLIVAISDTVVSSQFTSGTTVYELVASDKCLLVWAEVEESEKPAVTGNGEAKAAIALWLVIQSLV